MFVLLGVLCLAKVLSARAADCFLQLSLVTTFVKARDLKQDLVESILNQFRDLRKVDMAESSQVFDKLSNSLQVEVARCTSKLVIEKVPIMAECNTNFLDALVVLCRVRSSPQTEACFPHRLTCPARETLTPEVASGGGPSNDHSRINSGWLLSISSQTATACSAGTIPHERELLVSPQRSL